MSHIQGFVVRASQECCGPTCGMVQRGGKKLKLSPQQDRVAIISSLVPSTVAGITQCETTKFTYLLVIDFKLLLSISKTTNLNAMRLRSYHTNFRTGTDRCYATVSDSFFVPIKVGGVFVFATLSIRMAMEEPGS